MRRALAVAVTLACAGSPGPAAAPRAGGPDAAEAVARAQAARRAGRPEEALRALRAEAERCRGDARCGAHVAVGLGEHHLGTGAYPEAEAECTRARAAAAAAGDRLAEALAVACMAEAAVRVGAAPPGVVLAREAVALARAAGDARAVALARIRLGTALRRASELPAARAEMEALLRDGVADPVLAADARRELAHILINGGRPAEALEALQPALAAYRAHGDRFGEAGALARMGSAYKDMGESARAGEHLERSVALWREVGNPSTEAETLTTLAHLRRRMGDYALALAAYERAVPVFLRGGNRYAEAVALGGMAATYTELGDGERALAAYARAVAVWRALGERVGLARALIDQGDCLRANGRHREALSAYEEALPLQRATDDRWAEGRVVGSIGAVQADLGDHATAEASLRRALTLRRTAWDRAGEADTLAVLGTTLVARGRLDEGLAALEEALPVQRTIGDRAGEAMTLSRLARALRARAPGRAALHGKQAINVYQSVRAGLRALGREAQRTYARAIAVTYRELADLLAEQGRLAEAQQVLSLLKDEEYFELVRGETGAAEAASYAGREAPAAGRYDALAGGIAALAAEHDGLKRKPSRSEAEQGRFDELGAALAKANAEFAAFLASLDAELRAAPRRDADVGKLSAGVRKALAKGTVAIFTLAGEKTVRTILVTPHARMGFARPVPLATLSRLVLELRQALQQPSADPRPAARALYDAIVAPLAGELKGVDTILWWLDGPLRYVPMGALHDGERWLVQRWRSAVLTGSDLALLAASPQAEWSVLGLGVTRALPGFSALPGVADELSAVVQDAQGSTGILPGRRRLDGEFTRQALTDALGGGHTVIHVASHFAFRPTDTCDAQDRARCGSFLLLGDGDHLTLAELKAMANVFDGLDLLTLSACETAMDAGEGSEVDGLARVAADQGAKSVLATLWRVSDASTPALMRRFYELRQGGTRSTAEALREAQREMAAGELVAARAGPERGFAVAAAPGAAPAPAAAPAAPPALSRGWTHPYYWAAFILLGNGR